MTIDSFKFLPRVIARFYQLTERTPQLPIPFVRPERPLPSLTISLLTSAGLYLKNSQPPFDLAREKEEPTWGDPSWRLIPSHSQPDQLAISHLHINPTFIEQDVNVAPHHISLMGYQGFPPDGSAWEQKTLPEISAQLQADQVDGVVLVPT